MSTATSGIDTTARIADRTNPFPGLRPFREEEEYLFFGRESQVNAMVDKLAATRFLSVVGTSGSGKSSLVNCGLRPGLHRGLMGHGGTTWRMAQFRPGNDPVRSMAAALAQDGVLFSDYRAGGLTLAEIVDTTLRMSKVGLIDIVEQARLADDVNLLVVVDQFEELFRYGQLVTGEESNPFGVSQTAVAFVNLLLEAKEARHPIHVVLTMRSDFLGECAQIPGLAEAVNDGQYLVPRMTRDERRSAITGPIGVGGAEIEPVLLTRLVNDVGDNPDQLSILQHALNRTWARWQFEGGEGPLSLAHYESIGTMARALDQHAERAYDELGTPPEQDLCAKIFKALTDKATDPRGVRRPTKVSTLCDLTGAPEADVAAVIDVFRKPSRSFLMPPAEEALHPETVVDISHESLMRVWQRLNVWAGEEAQSARIYGRLAEDAAQHETGEASLLRDPELQFALNWRDRNQPNETWAERYQGGFAPAMRFLAESEAARERERRAARRRRIILIAVAVVLAALLVISAALGFWAFRQKREAERQRQRSDSQAMAAESLRVLDSRFDDAMRLALAAHEQADTIEARDALVSVARRAGGLVRLLRFAHPITSVDAGPGGAIAVAFSDGSLVILDRRARRPGPEVPISANSVEAVAFDPSRLRLAAASAGTVKLHGLRRNPKGRLELEPEPLGEANLRVGQGEVRSVAFSRDGSWLAAGGAGGVTLWRVEPAGRLDRVPLAGSGARAAALDFTGAQPLLAATSGRGLRVWNLGLAHPTPSLVESGRAGALALRPGGGALAVNGRARLWHGLPGAAIRAGPGGRPTALAFDSSGTLLASGHADGSVGLWDDRRGVSLNPPLRAHGGKIVSVAFEPGSSLLAVGSKDHTVTLWDTGVRARLVRDLDFGDDVMGVAFGRNGSLAALTRRQVLKVGSLDSAASPTRVAARGVRTVTASTDGRRLLILGNRMSVVRSLGARAGRRVNVPVGAQFPAISRTGVVAAVVGPLDELRVWDDGGLVPTTLEPPRKSTGVHAVAVSADGRSVAASYWDSRTIVLWRRSRGGWPPGGVLDGPAMGQRPAGISALAFDPGGDVLASGDDDGTITLWRVGKSHVPIPAHEGAVRSLAFAPVGGVLASGGDDRTLRLWDRREGKALGDPIDLGSRVEEVGFSPDGRWLVALHSGRLTAFDTTLWQSGTTTFARVRSRFCASLWSQIPAAGAAACSREG